jgi:hypothetical protein
MKHLTGQANASSIQYRNYDLLRDSAFEHFAGLGFNLIAANPTAADKTIWKFSFPDIEGIEQLVSQAHVDAFMLAHDNSILTAAQVSEAVQAGAVGAAAAVEGWATWSAQEAGTWATTNLVLPLATIRTSAASAATLAAARTALVALIDLVSVLIDANMKMGRMVIALRNKEWPHLQGD